MNADVWLGSWEYAQVGDSLIKNADTLMIVIKKPDGTSDKFYFKYK